MSDTRTLHPATHAMHGLSDALQWGSSAEHPGLIDSAHTTAHHMGTLIGLMRDMWADAVVELRERNLAAREERAVSGEQPGPRSQT